MIQIDNHPLSQTTLDTLRDNQTLIDVLPGYKQKVDKAKQLWSNRTNNAAFREVRQTLTAMCAGARRCMYCEDSCADEVEHIKPKSWYPDQAFVWDNYLYACGICNPRKNNQFAVFSSASGQLIELKRGRDDPILAPEPGTAVFINPRQDNPLSLLELDLISTFRFLPSFSLVQGSETYQRATYTIKVLALNRDVLTVARRNAYSAYRARLSEYITQKVTGTSPQHLANLKGELCCSPHPTVWQEMKRQHTFIPELNDLFQQLPEALDW